MVEEWDEKEKKKIPLEKFLISKTMFDNIISDCYAFRFMYAKFPQFKTFFDIIREISEEAHKTFGTPTEPYDRIQIRDFIHKRFVEEIKKFAKL